MNNFLDTADNLRRSRDAHFSTEEKTSFDLVFRAINALRAAHSKAELDTDNLESVFGAFEMARLSGRLASLSGTEVEALNPSMRSLIVGTLERAIRLPVTQGAVFPPRPYADFVKLITNVGGSSVGPVSIITFNYDLNLDYMLYFAHVAVDYCFDDKPTAGIPVMKLHGSVNWARCTGCSKVVPWALPTFFQKASWDRALLFRETTTVTLNVGAQIATYAHCTDHACEAAPVIVPPTWNKAEYQQVATVWKHAASHLSEAENIIVIGYSLPETDQFFRYLFALGTIGDARPQRFWVVDPDAQAAKRFEALLGPSFRSRFRHYRKTFSEAIGELQALQLA